MLYRSEKRKKEIIDFDSMYFAVSGLFWVEEMEYF